MHTQKVLKDFAKNEIKIIAKFKRSVAEIFYFIFAKFKTFLLKLTPGVVFRALADTGKIF